MNSKDLINNLKVIMKNNNLNLLLDKYYYIIIY